MWQLLASLKSNLAGTLTKQSNKLASAIATSNKTSTLSRVTTLGLTVTQGVFLLAISYLDNTNASDSANISIGKNPSTDNISISDAAPTNFIGKNLVTDFLTVSDPFDRTVAYNRVFTDPISATDDIDGAASLEDDQVAQFFKNLAAELLNISDGIPATSIGKNPDTEQLSISDVLTVASAFARTLTETPTVADTGSLLFITYVDSSYFSEDYAGTATIF